MSAKKLNSSEKTAILMVALGEDIAATIMKKLDQDELRRVSQALSRMGRVGDDVLHEVMDEFHGILSDPKISNLRGGFPYAAKVIARAFPGGNQDELLDHLREHDFRMSSLDLADAATLGRLLYDEHPQTIAMLLAFAPPKKGGEILKSLPDSLQTDLITRIANIGLIDFEVLQTVDEHLTSQIRSNAQNSHRPGGLKKAASILKALHGGEDKILDELDERAPDLARKLKQEMLSFQDLLKLDDRGWQTLLKECPKDIWPLAMRGVNQLILDALSANLSQRAAENFKEDMEALGPQRLDEVRKAQGKILEVLQQQIHAGAISLTDSSEKVV